MSDVINFIYTYLQFYAEMTSSQLETKPKSQFQKKQTQTGSFFSQNIQIKQSILLSKHQLSIQAQCKQFKNQKKRQKNCQNSQYHTEKLNFSSSQPKKSQNLPISHQQNSLKSKRKKICKVKSGSHITKNYLPFLKQPHFKYLQQNMSQQQYNDLFSDPQLKNIRDKLGMAMKDFQYLYSVQACRDFFKQMFEEQSYLEHAIMTSKKSSMIQKIEYLKKIQVLKKAQDQQRFPYLNESNSQKDREER